MKFAEFFKDFDNGVVPHWFIDKNLRDKDNDELVVSKLRTWPSVIWAASLGLTLSAFSEKLPFKVGAILFAVTITVALVTGVNFVVCFLRRRHWKPAIERYGMLRKMGCFCSHEVMSFEQSREAGIKLITELCFDQLRQKLASYMCDSIKLTDNTVRMHDDEAVSIELEIERKVEVMIAAGLFTDRQCAEESLSLCYLRATEDILQYEASCKSSVIELKVEECLGDLGRKKAAELLCELTRVDNFVRCKAITPAG